jgi:mycoredoxin
MTELIEENIILYSSRWCGHSLRVEKFLTRHEIKVERISIDGNSPARQKLIEINSGYASVPTLIFPDGSVLTEPTFSDLREKLAMDPEPGMTDRLRGFLKRGDDMSIE